VTLAVSESALYAVFDGAVESVIDTESDVETLISWIRETVTESATAAVSDAALLSSRARAEASVTDAESDTGRLYSTRRAVVSVTDIESEAARSMTT